MSESYECNGIGNRTSNEFPENLALKFLNYQILFFFPGSWIIKNLLCWNRKQIIPVAHVIFLQIRVWNAVRGYWCWCLHGRGHGHSSLCCPGSAPAQPSNSKDRSLITGKWLGDSFIEYFYITKTSLEIATCLCSFHEEKQKAASSRWKISEKVWISPDNV